MEGFGPSMRINQNIAALSAYRALADNQNGAAKATERLSSGLRINRAADDAAGLAISESMRSQVNGLNQGQRNSGDGISLLRTAEGALNETHAILQRMRTLAVQAANTGVMTSDNLPMIQTEMTQLTADIDRIAYKTEFNGMPLLDGTFRDKELQVGANAGDTKTIDIMSGITPAVPARPPIPAEPAAVALWEVNEPARLAAIADPVSFTHTVGGQAAVIHVAMPAPLPQSVTELVDRLNADAGFSAKFTAEPGIHTDAQGVSTAANLIIYAKEGGAGDVSVAGIPNDTSQLEKDPGRDETPGTPEIPARYGGYGSVDILGAQGIDVTREAGSSTSTYTVNGPKKGFGTADDRDNTTTITTTTTWGSGGSEAIGQIDRAIAIVSRGRAEMGATENALDHTIRSVGVSAENLALSESRIRDADMAKEITELKRWEILIQASTQMLAQANAVPQTVLKLLQ